MERLTPPPSGRLVPKIWTQWPLSPRLIKNFGPDVRPSNPQEKNVSVEGSQISKSVPATTKPDDEKAKERKDIRQLRLLSPVRTKQKHDSFRRIGCPESCSWMFSTPQFREWLGHEYSAVLCCYGPPGCGKTVLASGVIEALKSSDLDDVEVTYYYCDYADKASLEPAFILGALVRGLLRNYNIPEQVGQLIEQHYFDGKRTPETSDVFQVLMQTVCWFQNVILVVDGIDEVDEADRNTILRCLKTLISCPGLSVKVLITSREDQNVLSILSPLPEASFRVSLLESATSNNIESYVRDSVELMLPVVLDNANLKDEVIQTLITGAKGIFLWVKLQLETLRLASCEDQIKPILQDLPKDLDETYDRLLQRLAQSSSHVLISRMFECMIAARRPLTMEELCEGMAFTLEDRRWDDEKIPINDLNVLGTYGGLVVFDEKTRIIRLANYTVQQYLLRERPRSCYQFNLEDANKHLGEVCIAYLCFEDFEEQNSPINNRMAVEEMLSPISPVDQPQEFPPAIDIASITIGFRQSMSMPSIAPQQSQRTFENFGLHRYAKKNWLWHAARFAQSEKSEKRDKLFQSLVTQKQLPFEFRPWSADLFLGNPYPDQMGWAITHNNPSIIKSLSGFDQWFDFKSYIRDSISWVFKNVVNNCLSGEQLESIAYFQDAWNESLPMHGWAYFKMLIAARKGNLSILNLCRPDLDKPERPWNQFRAHLILEAAAANQHAVIDSFKLAQGPMIEQSRSFTTEYAGQFCNALERAALNGHADMVRRLGRAGWSASNIFGSRTSAGIIALNNAVLGNNSDVIKALLTALELTIHDPKDPTSQKDSRLSIKAHAFCKAASAGHVAAVKTFLQDGASPVAADESGMNAYMQAIKEGHMNIFELLFPLPGCGIEGNSTGFPLALAAAHGRTEIVEFLIYKGANVFQTDGLAYRTQGLDQKSKMPGPTPLYAAAANGHYDIVERLLAAGAGADVISTKDVVQPVDGAESARQRFYAPEQEPLAALGVIHPYQRPLCGAALNGHFWIVQLLLGAQALVNPSNLSENSPLLLALIGGHADVANLLSSKGAEIRNTEMAEQALLACSMCPDGMRALQLLIEYGVSPKCTNFLGESSLHIATTAGLPDIMKFLIKVGVDVNAQDNLAQTPLMRACNSQNYRAAWILTTSGANLSATDLSGNSALSWTSVSGNAQIAHLLLSNGAPANSPNLVRQTPLLEAALAGDHTMVKLLLGYGANLHARTGQVIDHHGKKIPRGSTALMIATIMNEPKVIGALCVAKKGVEDVEFEDRRTSLLLAAENGKLATFHALVKGGASLKARSSGGLSALDLAVRGINIEVLEYIMALQKQRLKAKKEGIFSREEFSGAIGIMPNQGRPLSAEMLIKLMKLGVRQEESEDCVPMTDPSEELWGW